MALHLASLHSTVYDVLYALLRTQLSALRRRTVPASVYKGGTPSLATSTSHKRHSRCLDSAQKRVSDLTLFAPNDAFFRAAIADCFVL